EIPTPTAGKPPTQLLHPFARHEAMDATNRSAHRDCPNDHPNTARDCSPRPAVAVPGATLDLCERRDRPCRLNPLNTRHLRLGHANLNRDSVRPKQPDRLVLHPGCICRLWHSSLLSRVSFYVRSKTL